MALMSRKQTENFVKNQSNPAVPEEQINGQVSAIDQLQDWINGKDDGLSVNFCKIGKSGTNLGDLSVFSQHIEYETDQEIDQETGYYIDPETGEIFSREEIIPGSGISFVKKQVVLNNLCDYTNAYIAGEISKSDWEEKASRMAGYIRSREELISAIDAEKKTLDERKKVLQDQATRLREDLLNAMNVAGVRKFETGSVQVSTRTSKRVEVFNEDRFREARPDLFVEKTTYRPDKTAIKAALSDDAEGKLAPYAGIAESKSLTIK